VTDIELDCSGEEITVDPESGDALPDLDLLFTVRLSE
jgi:hypothetical protein